FQSFHCA
ncbi:hypothetical protein VC116063_000421B, partial [Vibrio cholerae O1 str. 116063]